MHCFTACSARNQFDNIEELLGSLLIADCELIERFWVANGGKPHVNADLIFYQSDWTMIMDVVEMIEKMGYHTIIYRQEDGQEMMITNGAPSYNIKAKDVIVPNEPAPLTKTKIQAIFETVVKFIFWHNKQQK